MNENTVLQCRRKISGVKRGVLRDKKQISKQKSQIFTFGRIFAKINDITFIKIS